MSYNWTGQEDGGNRGELTMEMPLFPLETVLFPGMVMPLHIFEPRYIEMINRCLDETSRFGVVLIKSGQEVGGTLATPHLVGTAARIARAEHYDNGHMDITIVGTQRFRIEKMDSTQPFLTAETVPFPFINGSTKAATEMAHKVRPLVLRYVDILSSASNTNLRLDRLPEDPKALAVLVSIALQVNNDEKQRLLEIASVPEMLDHQRYLLSLETKLMGHMMETQSDIERMGIGSTGYIFPN